LRDVAATGLCCNLGAGRRGGGSGRWRAPACRPTLPLPLGWEPSPACGYLPTSSRGSRVPGVREDGHQHAELDAVDQHDAFVWDEVELAGNVVTDALQTFGDHKGGEHSIDVVRLSVSLPAGAAVFQRASAGSRAGRVPRH